MYDVIIVDFAQIADIQWNIGQNWVFCQRFKDRNFNGFFLTKEENDVSNIKVYCKIQDHTKKIFFKIVGTDANLPHDIGCLFTPGRHFLVFLLECLGNKICRAIYWMMC